MPELHQPFDPDEWPRVHSGASRLLSLLGLVALSAAIWLAAILLLRAAGLLGWADRLLDGLS